MMSGSLLKTLFRSAALYAGGWRFNIHDNDDQTALRAGLLALPDQKIVGTRLFDGLVDVLAVLADSAVPATRQAPITRLQRMLNAACAQRASSRRAMFSTGGIRRPDAGCAPVSRTITCGCRW
jgi:hypothetical protein